MGYILPVSHFEYMDYQKRVIKAKDNHHYVEKPFKVKLDMQQQFNYDDKIFNQGMEKGSQINYQHINLASLNQTQAIAEITGKGSLFNKSV